MVAVLSRKTNQVRAELVRPLSGINLRRMVAKAVKARDTVYTDQNAGYVGIRKMGNGLYNSQILTEPSFLKLVSYEN